MRAGFETQAAFESAFAADVRRGLRQSPKELSCTFFYDEEGSRLFEEICDLPEYYLTRAEREILTLRAPELAESLPEGTALVELGSGSSAKTRLLIDALLARQGRLRYLPIDVSRTILLDACAALVAERAGLDVRPIAADYEEGLRRVAASERSPRLVAWLGSSIGNFHPAAAVEFLHRVREQLAAADRLLVGIDLRKDKAVLEAAYDDASGTTARFNLNLLRRINRELGGHFDLRRFQHHAVYDDRGGCVSMYLVSDGAQRVSIDALDLEIEFADGEPIHTESSYKYSLEEIDALATASGFSVERRWLDGSARFSLNVLRPESH